MNQEEPTPVKQSSEIVNIGTSFLYPLCKDGLVLLLVVGGISLGIALIQSCVQYIFFGSLLTGILRAMLWGSILGYVLHVITKTADGEDAPPDWQDISDWNDILRPIFLLCGVVLISFGPAIAWFFVVKNGYVAPSPIFWLFILWGCFYFPMTLTAAAMMNSFSPLNPVLILLSIFRVGWVYLYAGATLVVAVGTYWFITSQLPQIRYVTGTLSVVLQMYLLMVTGRICGLIYRLRRDKLSWPCE